MYLRDNDSENGPKGSPYYVGKGSGYRARNKTPQEIKPNSDKSNIRYIKENISEEDAFMWEVFWIAEFGRIDLGTGCLRNKTDGGEGVSGTKYEDRAGENNAFFGKEHSEKTKKYLSTIKTKFYEDNPDAKENIGSFTRGKTYTEAYGEDKAKELHNLYSEQRTGDKNGMYAKHHKESSIELIKAARERQTLANRLKPNNRKFCVHCNKDYQLNNYDRYHGTKCKKYIEVLINE